MVKNAVLELYFWAATDIRFVNNSSSQVVGQAIHFSKVTVMKEEYGKIKWKEDNKGDYKPV